MEMKRMDTRAYVELEDRLGAHNYHPLDVVVERAEGCWVYDVEGKKYLDCLAAYSAVNQGHCHPRLVRVMKEQAEMVTLTSRAFRNAKLGPFYEALAEATGMARFLPMNSGAEAVETAIKAARKWGYKVKGIPENQAEIIVCSNNFHGRTTTIVGFSSDDQYREGFGPFAPGFHIIPFGDIDALRSTINANTCAFLVEPIQGEAGIIIPPDGFLKEAESVCRQSNVLLLLDEIQSGLGRTGKMFAHQWEDVFPDGLIIGKALSGGFYPVSAFCSNEDVMGVFHPGDHGSTFGGNPLGAAIAREALAILKEENLVEKAAELGPYFMGKLRSIRSDRIKEVRGRGLWIGLELDRPARPDCEALQERGMLCKETHEMVIRIAPPLVITKDELDWAFEQVKAVLGS